MYVRSRFDGDEGGPAAPGGFTVVPPGRPHAGRILAGGFIQYSDDRGATWANSDRPNIQDYTEAEVFAHLPSGRILYNGRWGVMASDDDGTSFAPTPIYGDYRFEGQGLAALATPGSTQSGAPSCGLTDASLCDGAVALSIEVPYDGIFAYRTSDGGRTWSERYPLPVPDDGIGYGHIAGVVALPPGPDGLGRAVAVLGRGMVYRTLDGGQSWQAVARVPLSLDGSNWAGYVLLGPDGHLWLMISQAGPALMYVLRSNEPATAALAVAGEESPASGGARLDVRPNPSGGLVSVRLTLWQAVAAVRVSVFDARGRRVALLHDGPLGAGEQAFVLDTAGLPSGIYIVRAEGTGLTAAARLTVAR